MARSPSDPARLPTVEYEEDNAVIRPRRVVLVAIVLLAAVFALVLLLPSNLRFVAVIVALVAGIGLERFRQSHLPPPPTLRETPRTWMNVIRYEVGYRQIAIALVLLAGAGGILLLSFEGGDEASPVTTDATPPIAGDMPEIVVEDQRAGEGFVSEGVRFEVDVSAGASSLVPGAEERGDTIVAVNIAMENEERGRFNPALLDYRLRAADGILLGPERSTAVGSKGLVSQSTLPEGDRVTQKLLFAVPSGTEDVALEFEPVPNGSRRIRVPIDLG